MGSEIQGRWQDDQEILGALCLYSDYILLSEASRPALTLTYFQSIFLRHYFLF